MLTRVPPEGRISTLGRRLPAPLEVLQVLPELGLSPRNVPGVDHEDDPDQSVGCEEKVISHTIPHELSALGHPPPAVTAMIHAGQARAAPGLAPSARPTMPFAGA